MSSKHLLASMLIMLSANAFAQTGKSVGGTIIDENGEPLIGVAVRINGNSNVGTVTDVNGQFSLPNVKPGEKLEITYMGMQPQTVKASSNMHITMEPDDRNLDEVIVVAYGEQKKSSFTGSAGVINADKIAEHQVTNVMDALDGQVAGVQISKSSGDPTATPSIHIRGISSINAGTSPLIVVDGAPYYGSWSDINPADVASMTVLKDAASNALYGARGANGVILITTKNPQKGRTIVTLDAKWGSNSRASQKYDVIDNPGQYYETFYKALYNYNINTLGETPMQAYIDANERMVGPVANGGLGYDVYTYPSNEYLIGINGRLNPHATLGRKYSYNGQDYYLTPDDWMKEAYRSTVRQEYNVNINGGNDAATFYGSFGYLKDPGIAYGSDYTRYTARMKATYQAFKWMKVGGNVNYAHGNMDNPDNGTGTSTFYFINRIAPIYPLYVRDGDGNIMTDANGRLYDYGDNTIGNLTRPLLSNQNPLKDDQIQTRNTVSNSFYINGFVDITPDFVKGLKITLNGTVNDYEYRYTSTSQPFYGWGKASQPNGRVYKEHDRYYTVNFQQLINYVHSFGKHNMTLLLGHENYKQTDEDLDASRLNMFSYFDNQELTGAIKNEAGSSSQTKYNTEGYFFRGMYDYDSKYFGQFSYRRDASSRFHPDHRWGNFYSFGAAWMITKESWMEPSKDWLNLLKLKFSFGQQGNDNIGNFLYMDTYTIDNSNDNLGLTLSNVGNPNITWETNTNVNAGIEFELFHSALRGSVEYFYRRTSNMLCFVNVPLSDGYPGYWDNIGNMRNNGIEIDLSYDIFHKKNLLWTVNLNATHYRNKITKLYEGNKSAELEGHPGYVSGDYFYGEGLPIYTWRLKKYAGVGEDGTSRWYINNDNGTMTKTSDYSSASYYECGSPTPDLYGGFGTTLEAYGLDFNVNFTYQLGGKAYDSNYQILMATPSTTSNGDGFHKDVLKAWTPENATSNIPRFQYNDTYANATSDRFLTSARYLNLQSITLGYTLPNALTKKIGLSKVRFYCTADNVYLWTARKGFDPRTSFSGAPSEENYSLARTISGGLTIQF